MSWMQTPVHVMDFEGTRRSGVLEFGVVTFWQGTITACRTRLCRAEGVVAEADRRVHRIHEADTQGCAPFSEEWDYFVGLRRTGLLAAHSAAVESGMLRAVWPCPPPCPDFLAPGTPCSTWGPWVDTCALAGRLYPGLPAYGLGELVGALQLKPALEQLVAAHCPPARATPHCALYDALAATLILASVSQNPLWCGRPLAWLLAEGASSRRGREEAAQGELF